METKVVEIAERIKGLREMMDISQVDLANSSGVTLGEYIDYENGKKDFNFTFLYKCAEALGVDIVELLTGENPKLSFYSIIRSGKGLDIKRREGFLYEHLGYRFKGKMSEPFLVKAPALPGNDEVPITLSTHAGQEFDFVISGSLRVRMEDHEEILNAGDCIYYDSGRGHGMVAVGDETCVFLAVVMKEPHATGSGEDL